MLPPEISSFSDPSTGARVYQLTAHPSINHLPYFLQSSFSPNLAHLIFTSYRTGEAQLFEAAFPNGDLRQLTFGPPIHPFSPTIAPNGAHIFFVRSGGIWRLDWRTRKETPIVEFPSAQLGECTLGDHGRWITAAYKKGSRQGLVTGRTDGRDFKIIPFPRTVIHPQFHPLDPQWLEFAADPAPRMYRVRRDGASLECLYNHDSSHWITHETFLGHTGDLIFVHWPRRLFRLNWNTRAITPITDSPVWHVSPNPAGTRVLHDTNHPDLGIFEVDVATGARRQVCLSRSSNSGRQWSQPTPANWKTDEKSALSWLEVPADQVYGPQYTHPHPCYSPGEKYVTFTSDRTGAAQVYVAENTVTR